MAAGLQWRGPIHGRRTMRENRLRTLFAQQQLALSGWVSMGNSLLAEVLGHSGYDAVTVDLQHGPFSIESALPMLQAISSTPAVPLVRRMVT